MFKKSKNLSIHGGEFKVIKGKDLWRNKIAPGAFHNSRERLKCDPPKCHPQTRVAVIQSIINWIEDGQKTSFITWLNGPAGAGKSAIAQEIAELCYKSGCLGASFFWSRSAVGRNNEDRLIASLAYQLLTAIPQLRRPIEEAVETDRYIFTRDLATQMESLIIQPWKKLFENNQKGPVDSKTPKVIILDGLDECGTEEAQEAQQSILKVIADSLEKFPIPLCFLIASRPEKAIRHSFNDQPLLKITSPLILDEKYHPDDDIRLFLVESFESVKRTHELRSLLPRNWPTHNDINHLVRKSSGQFVYAATVVKFVRSSRGRPKEQLDIILGITTAGAATPFAELDALYSHIFSLVLKDHRPRALEILGFAMLVDIGYSHVNRLTVRQIETILSYTHGDLQLYLIDLHSVLHVPAIKAEDDDEDKDDQLRFHHASLRDFLLDPFRSKDFYIDQGTAYAHIAQLFLRYISEYSPDTEDRHSCADMVFRGLRYQCSKSPATRELLSDSFDFDPQKWASVLATGLEQELDWEKGVFDYIEIVDLQIWFQAQEAKVLEYFGPTRSLLVHLAPLWKAAVDLICGQLCHGLHEEYANKWENAATALTHPEIFRCSTVSSHGHTFEAAIGVPLFFGAWCEAGDGDSVMDGIKNYLRDQERSGRYFVDGGMYATLCLRLFKVVRLASVTLEKDGGEQGNDNGGTPEGDDDMDGEYDILPPDDHTLEFVIQTLPFYLSKADYEPTLAMQAHSLLSQKIGEGKDKLNCKISLLHEAIDLYLKTRVVLSSPAHQQFQMPTPNNRPINSEPEASIDRLTTPFELRIREEKRRRESKESLDSIDASMFASPTVPRPTKRLRMLNQATISSDKD